MIRLKRMAKTSFIYPLLRPRRFMMYCVGPASRERCRSMECSLQTIAQRTKPRFATPLSCRRSSERTSEESTASRELRRRDRRLRLEVDSFNQLSVFVQEFVDQFPQAKFLLTAREPRSWLRSIINQHLNVDVSNR